MHPQILFAHLLPLKHHSTIADARQLDHLCSSFNIQPAPMKRAQQPPRRKTAAAAVIASAQPREEGGRSSKP